MSVYIDLYYFNNLFISFILILKIFNKWLGLVGKATASLLDGVT